MPILLELQNLKKCYGDYEALKDLSISVQEGEIFGFLGPSGSGKTTTINTATGQLKPTAGNAITLGKTSTEIDESIYEQIGIVTDRSGVYERLTVYDNLKIFADLLGASYKRIDDLLERVGLSPYRKNKAGKLSKGQKQRLVLIRAILHGPRLLFLDEPTSGLDPTTARDVHELFLELKESGMGIFLTTHNMEEATKLCDEVALLDKGRILETGSPQEICLRYNHDKQYRLCIAGEQEVVLERNAENLAEIMSLLRAGRIETIHSCEPTLEDVFVQLTGRALA